MAILPDLRQLQAEIEALRAENARLAAAKQSKMTFKVSEKGALSVYGMGRWPVTLYRGQWERLLGASEAIQAFIKTNDHLLKVKAD